MEQFSLIARPLRIRVRELDKEQCAQAFQLLGSVLSAPGIKMTEDIFRLNQVLDVMTRNTKELNEHDYFLLVIWGGYQ